MNSNKILITGGDGYLGQQITTRLLSQADCPPIVLWVRAKDEAEFLSKKQAMQQKFPTAELCWGDLQAAEPFKQVNPQEIGIILHSASVTRFNVEANIADSVNIKGTRKLLNFSKTCPNLKRFGLLSSIYASGMTTGTLEEVAWDKPHFANHYERSKWQCENMLITEYGDLPWQIYRIATVIANDAQGNVTQYNALHNTLKLFFYGLLSLLPGKTNTPIYLVNGEFVAEAIYQLINKAPVHSIFHVCHAENDMVKLGELIDIVFECFAEDDDFKARQLLKPLFCDEESFDFITGTMGSFGSVVNESLTSISPFAKQLFIHKSVSNENLKRYMANYKAEEMRELVRSTCRYLVKTRWGRHHV